MATATNLFYFILVNTMGQFGIDLFAKEAVIGGIVEKDLFHESQFGRVKRANLFVITGKIEHFIKSNQVEVAVTDKALYPFQTINCRLK